MPQLFKKMLGGLVVTALSQWSAVAESPYFGIQVVDEETGRGVSLVELRTVNDLRSVSDNAGWIAFHEPGLMGREVFFYISGPGYERQKDGFGYAGVRLTPTAGGEARVKVQRKNVAERLGRLTGQGLYRDSELLGKAHPLPNLNPSGVMGQDSVQGMAYRGRLFFLWGDTNVPNYPLGNFRTTAATAPLNSSPEKGLAYDYFMDREKPDRLRPMMTLKGEGAVWMFGLLTVSKDGGGEALLGHYGRHPGLAPALEQGIAQFNDESGVFESVTSTAREETWRYPQGAAVRVVNADGDYWYFCQPFAYTRVRAVLAEVKSPASYEALRFDEGTKQWAWQKVNSATTQEDESGLIKSGALPETEARYQLKDAATGKSVNIHRASIQWNAHRKCFVLVGTQMGGREDPSALGEVWYAESEAVAGPWRRAVKVVTHPRYSYYNPIHHAFFDAEGGRLIYFEGTYSLEFSGNPLAPARYDYNQLMYRLDLESPQLKKLREP